MAIKYHTVVLESTHGRELARAERVPSSELVQCFYKFATSREAQACAIPIIFVDGIGYTSIPEFMKMINLVNEYSMRAGGARVF